MLCPKSLFIVINQLGAELTKPNAVRYVGTLLRSQRSIVSRPAGRRGVRDALKRYPEIEIVGEADDKADSAQAPKAVSALLVAHPEITGMAGPNAVNAAGKKGKIKIVCFDRDENMLQFMEDGSIESSVAQKTYLMSWLALTLLHSLAHDEIMHLPDWRAANAPPLPRNVDTGVMIITKENYRQFKHGR